MSDSAAPTRNPAPRFFDPLTQDAFQRLEHASSLKGLLKPFTGKGDLMVLAARTESLRNGLMKLAQQLLSQATVYPFTYLPVVLTQQSTSAGTTFLRWRRIDRGAMGVAPWANVIADPGTPAALVDELYALELQRIALNMQISLVHTIARQALDCANKMAIAEAVYRARIAPISDAPPTTQGTS